MKNLRVPKIKKTSIHPFGMGIETRSYVGFKNFRYSFNGKEKTDEISGEGNSYDFGGREYDPRLGKWFSTDPLHQFEGSQYSAFVNNPILHTDSDGRWIPGVDKEGRIFVTAEKGDDLKSLYKFFGGKENAKKYLTTQWFGKAATKFEIKTGSTVRFNSKNPYSQAMKDVKDKPEKYKVANDDEVNKANENYNCHTAAIKGTHGKAFHNEKPMDDTGERNPILASEYENVKSQDAVFGETVITFGDAHSAVFFGKSNDGRYYAFSKQASNQAPVVVPVTDLVTGNIDSPQGAIGNGYVGNPSSLGGEGSFPSSTTNPPKKTGQEPGAGGTGIKVSSGTGYFSPKKEVTK